MVGRGSLLVKVFTRSYLSLDCSPHTPFFFYVLLSNMGVLMKNKNTFCTKSVFEKHCKRNRSLLLRSLILIFFSFCFNI